MRSVYPDKSAEKSTILDFSGIIELLLLNTHKNLHFSPAQLCTQIQV